MFFYADISKPLNLNRIHSFMIRKVFLLLLQVAWLPIFGQQTSPWKGFEKVSFDFQGREAWYIRPAVALEGKPWVWRAHFPDWHTEMDSILVARGFHIAFVNTNNLFGHSSALNIWDDFYDYLTSEMGFSKQVALEAVSRGGLYAYGWAKRNPEKVSCIYAEAPVCDPRSWPGGKGAGKGAPKEWEQWLKLFGETEESARDFHDIPLNHLEGLAAFKVPVLHVVGPQDKVVPNEENTWLLVENYMKAGGPATVYTMSRSEQKNDGHHFSIERPEFFADFIQQNCYPVKSLLSSTKYIRLNAGLAKSLDKFRNQKTGTVAFLGGSITHNPGWRTKTIRYLQEQYPETEFHFISAGIPSLGSTPHAFRFEKDVLRHGVPDLLFLESAVNDRANGFSEKAQVRALEGICRQARASNPDMDIVLMAFADPDKNADWDAGKEPAEVIVHETIADHYGLPFINLAKEVYDKIRAGEFSWKYDFKDLHPSPFGQEIYFEAIKTLLRSKKPSVGQYALPGLIDTFSYTEGRYGAIDKAEKLLDFRYVSNWTPSDQKSTRKGFVEVPMLVGEKAGASLTYPFEGRAIGIAVVSGPDAGVISYSIDGNKPQQLDLRTQWSNQLHLPWYLMFDDELKRGKHTLKLTLMPGTSNSGGACRIVYFLVGN